jgi:hypothetical protein
MSKTISAQMLVVLLTGVVIAYSAVSQAAPPEPQGAKKETDVRTATKRVRIISVDLEKKTFVAVKALADPPNYEIPCQFNDDTKFLLDRDGKETTAEKLIFEGSLLFLNFSKDPKGPKDQLRLVNYAFPYTPKDK